MISTPFDPFPYSLAMDDNNDFLAKYQVALPEAISSLTSRDDQPLSESYEPTDYDVVCGRGKGSYNKPGNKRFRAIVREHIPEYQKAKTKFDKSTVLNNIIEEVKSQNNGTASFVKMDHKSNAWFVIADDQAREKVGHTIRESIAALDVASEKRKFRKVFDSKQSTLLEQQKEIYDDFVLCGSSQSNWHQFKQTATESL